MLAFFRRGYSLEVKHLPSTQRSSVRFRLPAPGFVVNAESEENVSGESKSRRRPRGAWELRPGKPLGVRGSLFSGAGRFFMVFDMKCERRRFAGVFSVLAGAGLVLLLGACRSKPAEDHRPAWVREAEARLQGKPTWQVSGSGVESGAGSGPASGSGSGSGFFGSGRGRGAEAAGGSAGGSARREEVAAGREEAPARSASREAPAASLPAGVEWGETEITVEVED